MTAEWGFSGVAIGDPAHYLDFAQSVGYAKPDRFLCWADGQSDWTAQENVFNPAARLGQPLLLWAQTPAKITISMPMCLPFSSGDTLAIGNSGANDVHWTNIGNKIIALGAGNCTIRLGWEFNGSWYPWHAKISGATSTNWVPLFRRIHDLMMACPGAAFTWDWCPSMTGSQFTAAELEGLYPGDAYVDYIGMDCYNQIGPGETWIPVQFRGSAPLHWQWWKSNNNGVNLDWLSSFASSRGKPISIPEWGQNVNQTWGSNGGTPNDDPYFVWQMSNWIKSNNVAYQLFFSAPGPSYGSGFDLGHQALGLTAWKRAFSFGASGPDPFPDAASFSCSFLKFAPAGMGAAAWISDSLSPSGVSSLDTGRIGYITAWGGSEYGYAYTYALSGQPTQLSIDADTGVMSLSSALAAGSYTFNIIAANRENPVLVANFPYTLAVVAGVTTTGTPTASGQVWHKTYNPASGAWGMPNGNDWTSVFNAMHARILSDQVAAGDGLLRATVPLLRGTTYQYTNNLWMNGIQYLHVVDAGSGALPILQCTSTSASSQVSSPMNLTPSAGAGQAPGAIGHQGTVKAHCATIATVAAGSSTVTLLNPSDASKIIPGRWHQLMGSVTQFQSYPPNVQYLDYVRVLAVNGTTVTLDRPLKYGYDQTWWETNTTQYGDFIIGAARLVPYDTGGTGGYIPSDPRIGLRYLFTNLNFMANPNATGQVPPGNTVGVGGCIDVALEGCQLPNLQAGYCKHVAVRNCTATWMWEIDKLTETMLFDTITSTGQVITAATGYQYVLFRNSTCGFIQLSPRQLRAINTSFDGTGDGSIPNAGGLIGPPVTFAYLGSLQYYDFGSAGPCTFTKGSSNLWAPAFASNSANSVTLGTTANWSGNQLQIPADPNLTTGGYFERWMGWAVPGAIISTKPAAPFSSNWGYVSGATSPGDGTALWLNITWVNGTKPTTGTIYLLQSRRLFFASGNTLTTGTNFASPGFAKETAAGFEAGWNFPTSYPTQYSG